MTDVMGYELGRHEKNIAKRSLKKWDVSRSPSLFLTENATAAEWGLTHTLCSSVASC